MTAATAVPLPNQSAHNADFHFEDLFSSSPAVVGSWGRTPDNTSHLDAFATTEEDIGEDQEYSDNEEEDVASNKEGKEGAKGSSPSKAPATPLSPEVESLKISSNIGPNSFTTLAMVGKGGFGAVHQVVFKQTNEVFAMKTLKKKHLIDTKSVEGTMTEKNVLRKVKHPFVVRLQYAFQSESKLHLVMDYINGGQLLTHMHKEAIFSEQQARFYIAQVILAIEHLHSLHIIHRDLKPENVLLDASGHCVLTDFGFAKEDVVDPESCSSFCGTLEYMAPEVVKKNKYGKPADWWGVGILLYDMMVGHPPFQSKNDATLCKKITSDKLKMPTYLSRECQSLMRGLLQRTIKDRLTVDQIKAHPFFKGMKWDKMLKKEIKPPITPITKKGMYDTSNFDAKFVNAKMGMSIPNSPLSTSQQLQFAGFSYMRTPPSISLASAALQL